MKYLPPFEALKNHIKLEKKAGKLMVSASYADFIEMIRLLITGVQVDDAWYRKRYPDIAAAADAGVVASTQTHFVNDGYFEGRLPFAIKVDEHYYLAQNPGVADYVHQELLTDGQQHFDENGYQEGRLPFAL